MKSPDRDAADEWAAVAIAQQKRAQKAEREAEEHKTDAEFWKHNAEVRASKLATLRRRVADLTEALEYARDHDHTDEAGRHEDCFLCKKIEAALSPPTRKE